MAPSQSVALLRESYAALNRGDGEAWLATLHPEAEMHDIPSMPDAKVYVGHWGLVRWLRSMQRVFGEGFRLRPEEYYETPGSILVRLSVGGDSSVDVLVYHVVELADGLIVRMRAFIEQSQALAAAGLWKSARPAASM
jgi:ketosteroid isomerase-like protein